MEYQFECMCCGKIFVAHRKNNVFCSRRCKDVSYKQKKGQDSRLEPRRLKCVICGKEFETFQPTRKTCSDECSKENERVRKRDRDKRAKNTWDDYVTIQKEKAKQRLEIKQTEKMWYNAIHTVERECAICGSLFYCLDSETKRTCSHDCSKEYERQKRKIRADKRINKNNLVDKDISLQKLYRRDDGICYLCGKPCDWNDYSLRNDIKICGRNYPSIEHVIPLARGGKHQWENVRLAHLSCNIAKGDTTPTYTKEMSKEHARKMAIARSASAKRTAQYTLDGKLIKIWDSTGQIERELGLNSKRIQNVCRRDKSKTGNAFGYHWEYIKDVV